MKRHITLSIQTEDGHPLLSKGITLDVARVGDYYQATRSDEDPYEGFGSDENSAILDWLETSYDRGTL